MMSLLLQRISLCIGLLSATISSAQTLQCTVLTTPLKAGRPYQGSHISEVTIFDTEGKVLEQHKGNGQGGKLRKTVFSYNAQGQCTREQAFLGTQIFERRFEYTQNEHQQITQKNILSENSPTTQIQYSYNPQGRLQSQKEFVNNHLKRSVEYTYTTNNNGLSIEIEKESIFKKNGEIQAKKEIYREERPASYRLEIHTRGTDTLKTARYFFEEESQRIKSVDVREHYAGKWLQYSLSYQWAPYRKED